MLLEQARAFHVCLDIHIISSTIHLPTYVPAAAIFLTTLFLMQLNEIYRH